MSRKKKKKDINIETETGTDGKTVSDAGAEDKVIDEAVTEAGTDEIKKEAGTEPESKDENENKGDDEKDLYSDEVYRSSDEDEEDIVFLDLSEDGPADVKPESKDKKEKKQEQKKEKKEKKKKEKKNIDAGGILITWLLVLLGSAVYISLTFNDNVWLDEAFTASLVNADMAEVIRRSMADTLPPLYNILLKLSTDFFGYSVPVMKMTSAVPMILTMILGATVVRKRYGRLTSCIFILALIVMPNMLFYGVEIRMYSLGFLFATAAGIYAGEIIHRPRFINWAMFTLSTVLAGYSHHFAFVTAGLLYLFLLIYACSESIKYRKDEDKDAHPLRIGSFILCLIVTVILYIPCLLVTVKQIMSVSGYFSMPDVTPAVFVKYCRYPYTTGFTPLSIILLLLVAFLFIRALFRKEKTVSDRFVLYSFVLYYLVLIFGTVISKVMTANIFVDRYLFFASGLIWYFFAIEAASLKKWAVYIIVILEAVIGIYAYNLAYAGEYAPGLNELTGWLNRNTSAGDSLYTLEEYEELAYCLPFYNANLTNYESLDDAVTSADGNNVWVAVLDGYEGTDAYDSDMEEIAGDGYGLEYVSEFRFDRYMFKMYKLAE
ncbi:MAG: glycosyltransferase family 39 protein [Lachnospiraceae bacterium]|nr:glycosyltransferase family 39 protein [Lachnospiraceae bacterium]